jgi:hypothetical protein
MVKFPFFGKSKQKKEDVQEVNKGLGVSTAFVATGTPVFKNYKEALFPLRSYELNPIVQAVINIKADAFANLRFKIKDLRTGEEFDFEDIEKLKFNDSAKELVELLSKPNPLQSTFEWLQQFKVNFEVFGNGYSYASIPVGFENRFTFKEIQVMNNLAPYCVRPVLTGKWLDATEKSEIISKYVFENIDGRMRDFNPNVIFHRNSINIKQDQNFTEGMSELIALYKPISNIDLAYESRNVLIKQRGALGMITPDSRDANGTVPLTPKAKEEVQEELEKYGTLEGQWQTIFTNQPLRYQKMAMSMSDLKLFEEIESDAIAVSNAKGVPVDLVRYHLNAGTFNNMDTSWKMLYDATIIPETKDFMIGLNLFLKTKEHGLELIGSYDHVKVLQSNQKDEATTNNMNEKRALSSFKLGAITYGEYGEIANVPISDDMKDMRIWDLSPEQLSILGVNVATNGEA